MAKLDFHVVGGYKSITNQMYSVIHKLQWPIGQYWNPKDQDHLRTL